MVSMAENNLTRVAKRLTRWRLAVQAALLLAWLDPLMLRLHTVCGPVFHCHSCPLAAFACPIGVLANFSAIHVVPLLALGTLFIVGAVFGSLVCGWACPFGLLQDLLARIGLPKFEPPAWTGWFRYAVLVGLVLAIPYFYGEQHALFFCRLCPAGALEAALPNVVQTASGAGPVAWPSMTKSAILVAFLAAALFAWRPWCTMLCPLGAIFTLFNGTSIFFLRYHPDRCGDCGLCRRLCHYGGKRNGLANQLQCVRCLECTHCKAVTLEHVFGRRNQPLDEPSDRG